MYWKSKYFDLIFFHILYAVIQVLHKKYNPPETYSHIDKLISDFPNAFSLAFQALILKNADFLVVREVPLTGSIKLIFLLAWQFKLRYSISLLNSQSTNSKASESTRIPSRVHDALSQQNQVDSGVAGQQNLYDIGYLPDWRSQH